MDTKIEKKLPWIKDLTWHRHPYYSLFAPMDWDYFQSPDDLDVIAEGFFEAIQWDAPDPENPTLF